MPMSSSHGPPLPYRVVAGVVPCRSGWLVASAKLQGVTIAPEEPRVFSSFIDVVDEKPAFSVIALYAPIGFLDKARQGGRTCDREARSLLGRRWGATVRSAPAWPVFGKRRSRHVRRLHVVTAALLPRYAEVAEEIAPYHQRVVYEVHPELSWYQLNKDRPVRHRKGSPAGRRERRKLLKSRLPGAERIIDAQLPGVKTEQLLDAAACLWTARRILARAATRIPTDPEWDSQGLRMEIVR